MKHMGLFEGIGGFSVAAGWMGWQTVAWCEWNPFCQAVLKYHFPEAEGFGDITKTDFTKYANTIDILTGGFPCQPYSVAGKRKGKSDERHLWPHMLRAIREVKPPWVVGENVAGLINWNGGMVFDEVQADLEAEGYEFIPFVLPACGKNAPHKRERVWFVAYSHSCRNNHTGGSEKGVWTQSDCVQTGDRGAMQVNGFSDEWLVANTTNPGIKDLRFGRENEVSEFGITSNTDSINGGGKSQERSGKERARGESDRSDSETFTHPDSYGLEGWSEETIGEKARRFAAPFHAQVSQQISWFNFPTQPPVCGGNDGLSDLLDFDAVFKGINPKRGKAWNRWRTEAIKAYGNAIVPPVALEIFWILMPFLKESIQKEAKHGTDGELKQ